MKDLFEALNRADELDNIEDQASDFYRRAEQELEKHFNCTGAFLEPSTQNGVGRTFLFADDISFDGSFDFETGEDYIFEDDFDGFLALCKRSFVPSAEEVNEGIFDRFKKKPAQEPAKEEPKQEEPKKEEDAFTTYTYEEWIQALEYGHKYYAEDGPEAGRMKLWSKAIDISASENLARDVIACMDDWMKSKGNNNFPHKSYAKHLKEAAFSGGMAGDNSASGGTIRGRGASTQPGKNNYLNRMKSKNPDLVDTMVIKVSDIKPGMITQAGQVKEAEARNHPSGGKKMYIMHTNGYDGFWGLDETMDVMVDPENKSKPFAGDYRALLKMGLQENVSESHEDESSIQNIEKILRYTQEHVDSFKNSSTNFDWLDDLTYRGVFEVPASCCADYENVTDDEVEQYITKLLSNKEFVQQLNQYRVHQSDGKPLDDLQESVKPESIVNLIVKSVEESGFTDRSISSAGSLITMEDADGNKTTYTVRIKMIPQFILEEELAGELVKTVDKNKFISDSSVMIIKK